MSVKINKKHQKTMSKEKNRCLDKETGQTRNSENDPGKNMKFGFVQNDI
jgi:hypothetical protein